MSNTDKPDYQSPKYAAEMVPKWKYVDAVLGGTYTMRKAADELLPQFPTEHDDVYDERVASATSDGDYKDTLDGLVGMVFAKPVTIGKNVSLPIRANFENIDLRGTHFNVFNQRLFRRGIHYGAAYVLVDMQRRPTALRGAVMDASQAKALNLRPYATLYSAKEVQNAPNYVTIRGAQTLQQIVFRESRSVPNGFGVDEVERFRVWRLPVEESETGDFLPTSFVEWEIWEQQEASDGAGGKRQELTLIDSDTTTLTEIPVAIFNANPDPDNETECEGPTLYDLAELCVKEFNKQSDFEHTLHYCKAVPFVADDRTKEDSQGDGNTLSQIAWGPGVIFYLGTGGAMNFAEPNGNAFPTWEKYLEGLKLRIKQKGLEMVMEGGNVATTATEQVLKAKKRMSRLAQLSEAVHDTIENVARFFAMWLGEPADAGGEFTMGISADELTLTAQDLTALIGAVDKNLMSRLTFLQIMKRAGLLPDEVTPEVEDGRIKEQMASEPKPVPVGTPAAVMSGAAI